jgi:hypothetical protein
VGPLSLGLALAWHGLGWGLVQVRLPPSLPSPPEQPLSLVLREEDALLSTGGLVRSPVLFALPFGPGFSRYLPRPEDTTARPREDFPDLAALAAPTRVAVTNRLVLLTETAARPDRLAQVPSAPEPETRAPPPPLSPVGLWASLPAGGDLSPGLRADLERLSARPWKAQFRAELSPAGGVEHLLLEQGEGLESGGQTRLFALLRGVRFPSGPTGRVAEIRLHFLPVAAP